METKAVIPMGGKDNLEEEEAAVEEMEAEAVIPMGGEGGGGGEDNLEEEAMVPMGGEEGVEDNLEEDEMVRERVRKGEAAVEEMVLEMIRRGDHEGLKTNSGKYVHFRDHVFTVYFDPPFWSWNGFLIFFHHLEGLTHHFFFGHYAEDLWDDDDTAVN